MSRFDMAMWVVGFGWLIALVGAPITLRLYPERGWTVPMVGMGFVVFGMLVGCSELFTKY